MSYQDIRVENRGLASWIVMNRPEAMNAVRPQT
jgi:1,4-dihydroxy-2-naphthoyl-CoA synthase